MSLKTEIFPKVIPEIKIERMTEPPFKVRYEEIPASMIPRVGEKNSFAVYSEETAKHLIGIKSHECIREALIHGIPCVQVDCEAQHDGGNILKSTYFVRLTDTHVSFIAEMKIRDDVFCFDSFYDDEWLTQYIVGENNIGREINQEAKGILRVNENGTIIAEKEGFYDIIGRYRISIASRSFDTVALADINNGVMHVVYIDANGRSILCRRYNRFNWKTNQFKALWTEKLPNSEVIIVNNEKYVHWFDCISDYVM